VSRTDDSDGSDGRPSSDAPTRQPTGLRVRLRSLWRAVVVIWQFVPLAITLLRDRRRFLLFGSRRDVTSTDRYRRARVLRETFVDLGPAFIKLGQMLSTRPDALPAEYVDVLSELQDRVPPAPWDEIEPEIERALGPVDEVFDAFDREPISGASLGQVYEAEIDGRRVAVKVLRPNVRRRVESDLRVVSTLIPLLRWASPPGQAFTFGNLATEFTSTIREEMDYAHESARLDEIRANFADVDDVAIPESLPEYSTDRVLTMSYVDGVKIDDLAGIRELGVDEERIVRRLTEIYIKMIVEDGVFHADPHPGNLAVEPDGTIVFYDFGMTGELGAETRSHLVDFYVGIATDDIDQVIDSFIAMEALDPTADRQMVRQLFEMAFEQFRGADLDEFDVEGIISEFEGAMYDFPMRIPQDLAHVVRVTTVLDGVTRALAPEYDFLEVITEYVMERGMGSGGEEIREQVTDQIRESARAAVEVPARLDEGLARVERGDLTLSTVIADDRGAFERMARRLLYGVLFSAGFPVIAYLYSVGAGRATFAASGVTALVGVVLLWSFRRRSGPGIGPSPQFTRQEIRRRQGGDDG